MHIVSKYDKCNMNDEYIIIHFAIKKIQNHKSNTIVYHYTSSI